jgi:integrase
MLYRLVKDFKFPDTAIIDRSGTSYTLQFRTENAAIAMVWPNGWPCIEIELYLADISYRYTTRQLDGGSLKVIASHLSHLLKYCYKAGRNTWELDDNDFKLAIRELQDETNPSRPTQRRRNGTTVDRIIDSWKFFLIWLQENWASERRIIGLREDGPQIPVEIKDTHDYAGRPRSILKYRYSPVNATPEPKGPISRRLRVSLWEAVARLGNPHSAHARYRNTLVNQTDFELVTEYLRKRRELLLRLLEATGARPGELARLLVSRNEDCTSTSILELETLKRRKKAYRRIPIEHGLAIQIDLFIVKHRALLLNYARRRSFEPKPNDYLFLTCKGFPLSEGAMTREFSRLVVAAEIKDQQACMSMFRHRFITKMVQIHILAYQNDNPAISRAMMSRSDYRTILQKVCAFTGHGSSDSLWPYIDMAWDEMGTFDYVGPAQELIDSVEQSISDLSTLICDVGANPLDANKIIVESAIAKLEAIRSRVAGALTNQTKRTTLGNRPEDF